ncbi:MAG: hypothetical protein JWR04_211 [Rhodoglobus sp.]|nr:hypothetical protein [Rhodoglobus sp.]
MAINLIYRNEQLLLGRTDLELTRALRRKEIVRVVAGADARGEDWSALEPIDQHRARVLSAARKMDAGTVFSHHAAAALWGIRILGVWPTTVDVTTERASGGRSTGQVHRHATGLRGVEVTQLEGVHVTTPAQTAVDLARVAPFAHAVAAIDSALHRKRRPGPLALKDEVLELARAARGPHARRLATAAEFATDRSDSVEESHSRVVIRDLGFPAPELQVSFPLPTGGHAETDFYWSDHDHAGECDGRSKYRDPKYLRGRSPEDVVIQEKNRENELRRVVGRLSRWEPVELYTPRRLYDRLTRDGLPSARPRP